VNIAYIAPKFLGDGFHCPHCGVYSHQGWYKDITGITPVNDQTFRALGSILNLKGLFVSSCIKCGNYGLWFNGDMIYPTSSVAPLPDAQMPDDVLIDFLEARMIVNVSPRASAALLRLALQKLMVNLGEKGDNLNEDIGNLVKKGLPEKVRQALDIVRVIGNEAVHPGEIDLKDDLETAHALFELLNMIVDSMITQNLRIQEMYSKLPEKKIEGIRNRDKNMN